jgi:hypothetical protein
VKSYGGADVYMHIFLTAALAGGESSASRPKRYCVLSAIPVFILHVTKLIQFTSYNTVAYRPVAMRRLCKHQPLLGNARMRQ